ncbi:MAG: GTP-binding protein [Candidatus Lokiarchaeota archaeon]|nr:GTP-binding protein [Candidatus Lokiarchaeota archaeon]
MFKLMSEKEYSWKIVVIGDYAVGKTSLLHVFTEEKFEKSYKPTLGVDILIHFLEHDNFKVKIVFWDIAGQILFSQLRKNFFSGSEGVLIVFDLSRRESFENLKHWINELNTKAKFIKERILIGNKNDLTREISTEEAKEFASKFGLTYIETSAKTGDNVDKAFHDIINNLTEKHT